MENISCWTEHYCTYGSNIAFRASAKFLNVFKYVFKMTMINVGFFSQIEIDNGDELTADFLYEEVHPKQHAHKQSFAKPRGPAGKRGIRRLIRGPAETETPSD